MRSKDEEHKIYLGRPDKTSQTLKLNCFKVIIIFNHSYAQ